MDKIQDRILALLCEQSLLQKDLAAYIGVSYSTLNSWLKRSRDIPAQCIIGICRFLSCSIEYLLTGVDDVPAEKAEDVDVIVGISDEAIRMAAVWDSLDENGKIITKGDIYRRAEVMSEPTCGHDVYQLAK